MSTGIPWSTVKGFSVDIDTGNHPPISSRPYRLPLVKKKWVEEEIARMLKEGIIRHSTSPWAAPIVVAPKADGKGTKLLIVLLLIIGN